MDKVYTAQYRVIIAANGGSVSAKPISTDVDHLMTLELQNEGQLLDDGAFLTYVYAEDAQEAAKIASERRRELLRG